MILNVIHAGVWDRDMFTMAHGTLLFNGRGNTLMGSDAEKVSNIQKTKARSTKWDHEEGLNNQWRIWGGGGDIVQQYCARQVTLNFKLSQTWVMNAFTWPVVGVATHRTSGWTPLSKFLNPPLQPVSNSARLVRTNNVLPQTSYNYCDLADTQPSRFSPRWSKNGCSKLAHTPQWFT